MTGEATDGVEQGRSSYKAEDACCLLLVACCSRANASKKDAKKPCLSCAVPLDPDVGEVGLVILGG